MDEIAAAIPTTVPVFPLPGVVLFPQVILPLHLFEPRYRRMAADALAASGYIALAHLRSGYEPLYYTLRAPIYPVVCIGQILASEKLDDGNYNVLLQGLMRARVIQEESAQPYRVATVEHLPVAQCPPARERALRRRLRDFLLGAGNFDDVQQTRWRKLLTADLEFGAMLDLLAADLPFEAEFQQVLLDEYDSARRAQLLLRSVESMNEVRRVRHRAAVGSHVNLN